MAASSSSADVHDTPGGAARIGQGLNWFRYNLALIIPAIAIVITFSLLHPEFMGMRNIMNLLREMTIISIVAVGLTIVMASGRFDMSFYGVGNFVVMTCGFLLYYYHLPVGLIILLGLGIGLGTGALCGLLVAKLRLPDIMATIGVASVFAGFSYKYTEGVMLWLYAFPKLVWMGTGAVGPVKIPVFFLIGVVICVYLFMYRTKFGFRISAVGTSPDAATHTGISVVRYRWLAFILAGGLYGLAGLIFLGRFGKTNPLAFDPLMLPIIAACFMGTAMFKGKANVVGTLIGVFILSVLANGLTLLNIHWTRADLYKPVIFLVALVIAIYIRKRKIVG